MRDLPDVDLAIIAARDEHAAVGAEGQPTDRSAMLAEQLHVHVLAAGGDVPESGPRCRAEATSLPSGLIATAETKFR